MHILPGFGGTTIAYKMYQYINIIIDAQTMFLGINCCRFTFFV